MSRYDPQKIKQGRAFSIRSEIYPVSMHDIDAGSGRLYCSDRTFGIMEPLRGRRLTSDTLGGYGNTSFATPDVMEELAAIGVNIGDRIRIFPALPRDVALSKKGPLTSSDIYRELR